MIASLCTRLSLPLAALSSLVFALGVLAAAEDPLLHQILSCAPIYIRQQRDQRMSACVEEFDGRPTAHVYLSLSDQGYPYTFSLGWFTPAAAGAEGKTCTDEFGEYLPAGQQPERPGFNPADLAGLKGFDCLSAGKIAAASKMFQLAVKLAPTSPRLHNNLGACAALSQHYAKAKQELDQALKLKPNYMVALTNRAWLSLSCKQPELALSDATAALKINEQCSPARLAAAKANLALGKIDQAVALTGGKGIMDPATLTAAGDALRLQGDLKQAALRYRKALLLSPRKAEISIKAAKVEAELGDLDQAMKDARSAIQVEPTNSEAHLVLGGFLEQDRQYRAAQLQYQRALDLRPPDNIAQVIYGPMLRVLLELNQQAEAEKLSQKWLAAHPRSADCHYNYAWLISKKAGSEGQAQAIRQYRQALLLKPDLAQAHYNLALLLVNAGQPEQACLELESFIKQAPQDPDVDQAKELLSKLRH